MRSALVEGLEIRQRGADAALTKTRTAETAAVRLRKPELLYAVSASEEEAPKRRKLIIPPMPPILQAETPTQYAKPPTYTPEPLGDILKYNPPAYLTTTATPTTADVPSPPAYTPVAVPKISEVPAVDVPTVPTSYTYPTPQPSPLPPGWWRLLPPDAVADGSKGAYEVQAGKKQILALA
jgi:hypothetical protein